MASYTYELVELGDEIHGVGCKCCRFKSALDLPIPKKLSTSEIKTLALRFSTSVVKDWIELNASIKRFEPTIQKRWLKKSLKQRKDILLTAWPAISKEHRPDFAGLRNTKRAAHTPRSRTLPSAAYLWPYINLEDLVQHNAVPLFISSRGREYPDTFIFQDIKGVHVGKGWELARPTSGSIMSFASKGTPQTYGAIIDLKPPPRRTAYSCNPTIGLLGLEVQAGIYGFLLKCTKLILHDIEPSQFRLAPHRPRPSLPLSKISRWSPLTEQMREAPYLAPQKLDFERLRELVAGRRAFAEDHIWLLREDPSYFVDALKETREHDYTLLQRQSDDVWGAATADLIAEAFTYLLYWHRIDELLQKLPSIDTQLRQACPRAGRLSAAHEKIWAELDELTAVLPHDLPILRLTCGLPSSPRLRHRYPATTASNLDELWCMRLGRSEAETRVDNIFRAITIHDDKRLHPLELCVQEAQHMLDTDPDCNALLDPWVLRHFEDLALLSELQQRISSFRPWSNGWRASKVGQGTCVSNGLNNLFGLGDRLVTTIKACGIMKVRDPEHSCWQYPADKTPNEKRVKHMRHAESHLDWVWDHLEDGVMIFGDLDLTEILTRRTLHPRTMTRTKPWVKPASEVASNPTTPVDGLAIGGSTIYPSAEPDTCSMPKPKVKVKTRGAPSQGAAMLQRVAEAAEAAAVQPPVQPTKTVPVPHRIHKVFSALLPLPSAEGHQRSEVSWDDFLRAMDAVGMEPEKLYGSVWIFKPKSECDIATRSIQFHEPKEVRRGQKIPARMVRVFGRRMKYTLGWEAGMFVCA